MASARFTKQTKEKEELDAIIEYYERIGAAEFGGFRGKVISKVRPLEQFPRMGRIVRVRELRLERTPSLYRTHQVLPDRTGYCQ